MSRSDAPSGGPAAGSAPPDLQEALRSIEIRGGPPLRMLRDPSDPYERHLLPDYEPGPLPRLEPSAHALDLLTHLPKARGGGATWNSVALFFNLTAAGRPADYQDTTAEDARNWLDEGVSPASPTISEFMCNYWRTLSYGRLAFELDTPRAADRTPLIPTVAAPGGNVQDWGGLINACLDANAEAVWRAAGSLTRDGKRWIPSIVLVQNYWVHASAGFGGYERTVGGVAYLIGDVTHMSYRLDFVSLPGVPTDSVRGFWGTLCHEYSHNFLEFPDLYGPQGCTGYWDLLGDNSPPGRMSEVCSVLKHRAGWLTYKQVVNGPAFPATDLELQPYTTTGEAYKVVPDPVRTPHEYFVLEYRKSTGTETWRPDGALTQEGLLILHIDERLGVSGLWLLRDAPFFDPEFADFSDNGGTLWTGHDRLDGVLFPQGTRNAFTRSTSPSSDLYGKRPSGLSITDIRIEGGRCRFRLRIAGNPRVGWTVGTRDRCLAGRFTPESATGGQEIFCRNDDNAALLVHREAQWLVVRHQRDWIGGWNLGPDDYEVVADLDGDGRDEVYVRSPEWAGVLKWQYGRFDTVTVQHDWIDRWNMGPDNRELAGDFDGDGRDEIYIRSPEWAGVLKLVEGRLRLQSIQHDWIDRWNLGGVDRELVGRFTHGTRDEILIRSPEWLGLLQWDAAQRKLRLRSIQHDRIDGWNMGAGDRHVVGDFDGDGMSEIYIRSDGWAGVLKWSGDRFRLLWIRAATLERFDDPARTISLQAGDRSYAGRFLPTRDGVLHRHAGGVAVLTWEGGQMKVRHQLPQNISGWNLGAGDNFVLGDFHRVGRDTGDPSKEFIQDDLTDVFIHNGWGTGMIGVNHIQPDPAQPPVVSHAGLTWIQHQVLLFDR